MCKLSIIVPIYNVESYIDRSLQSLCEQDIPACDYEIILIDDGSTDQSIVVAQQYTRQYPNIKLYSYPNGGLSVARNRGLDIAGGEYVLFVDSDDWITSHILSALIKLTEQHNNPDILAFEDVIEDTNMTKSHIKYHVPYYQPYSGVDYMSQRIVYSGVWLYAFKRSFIERNQLRMMEGIYHEDEEFLTRVFLYADKVVFTDLLLYHYYQREGSIVNDALKHEKRIADSLYVLSTIDLLRKEYNCDSPEYRALCFRLFTLTKDLILWSAASQQSDYAIKRLVELRLYPMYHYAANMKDQLVVFMLNHHRLFLWIFKYLKIFKG